MGIGSVPGVVLDTVGKVDECWEKKHRESMDSVMESLLGWSNG